ncbi:hypothetical protein EV356DRAFT_527868 [Viridothelium virens]|uniref:DUF4112 domain-containing protein n=1 Tax=Viridothelium virens TaxID=1048519 RepID=A0A6A6HR68_VIRVR|nr:hypothetical protein EV356DRAFT_527868 [Viridothelium virens]
MATAVGKVAAKKLLGKQMSKYSSKQVAGDKDPYFAYVENPRTGKLKKVKKQVPDYIPEHDALILAKVRKQAYRYDMALFNVAGVRFGWSSAIGLIPWIGDCADVGMAINVYRLCNKVNCKLDSKTKRKMQMWILADGLIGLVPIVGDFCDAAIKCNTQNLRLLELRLDEMYMPEDMKRARGMKVNGEKEKGGRTQQQYQPATVYEDFSDEDQERRAVEEPPPEYRPRKEDSTRQRKPKKSNPYVRY